MERDSNGSLQNELQKPAVQNCQGMRSRASGIAGSSVNPGAGRDLHEVKYTWGVPLKDRSGGGLERGQDRAGGWKPGFIPFEQLAESSLSCLLGEVQSST